MNIDKEIVLNELKIKHNLISASELKNHLAQFDLLSEQKQEELLNHINEIHLIYNRINSNSIEKRFSNDVMGIQSIKEYHQKIKPVSNIILDVSEEYNIDLKIKHSQKFNSACIAIFGEDYFQSRFCIE